MTIDYRFGRAPLVFSDIAPGTLHCLFTDPPYGTATKETGYGRRQLHKGRKGRTIKNDIGLAETAAVLPAVMPLLRDNAWVAVFCSPKRRVAVDAILLGCGLDIFGEVVWDRITPGLGYQIQYQHDTIIIARRGVPEFADWPLQSVMRHGLPRATSQERHPHAKPLALLMALLPWICPENGIVLDPFAGEAPIAVACSHLNRQYIGAEMDEQWYGNGVRAIQKAKFIGGEDAKGQGALL